MSAVSELRAAAAKLRSESWPSGPLWGPLADWLDDEAGRRYHEKTPPDPALRVARIINGEAS